MCVVLVQTSKPIMPTILSYSSSLHPDVVPIAPVPRGIQGVNLASKPHHLPFEHTWDAVEQTQSMSASPSNL